MKFRFSSIVLIVVGVLFLLSNLNVLSFRMVGELLRTWWPVILIALGVSGMLVKGK